MKRVSDMRQQIRTLFISLAGIVWCAFAGAAQEPYDLDLKELRRPPARRAKEQRPPQEPKKPVSAAPDAKGDNSSYTVRPGDHLFLILMHRYGLSNDAAEQLIPEVMRLNGIRKPKSLSVGQRLIIPLPPPTNTPSQHSRRKSRRSPQPETAAVQPQHAADTETAAVQPHAADTTYARELVAPPSQPCLLAGEVAEQLGVRVPPLSPLLDAESISVSYDVLKMAVVCGRAPAETYTLGRLLAQHGVKLLAFKVDEAPRTVIEGLAGRLGISFRLSNDDTAAELPLTYTFPAAIAGKDLKLTILPDVPASKAP